MKLQNTNTVYLYGVNIDRKNVNKHDLLNKDFMRCELKGRNIEVLDLKVFLLASLYPMIPAIFSDFSSQSKIYKFMFGFNFLL